MKIRRLCLSDQGLLLIAGAAALVSFFWDQIRRPLFSRLRTHHLPLVNMPRLENTNYERWVFIKYTSPSILAELDAIAKQYDLNLNKEDLKVYQGIVDGALGSYRRVPALEEPKLPVKYPRNVDTGPRRKTTRWMHGSGDARLRVLVWENWLEKRLPWRIIFVWTDNGHENMHFFIFF